MPFVRAEVDYSFQNILLVFAKAVVFHLLELNMELYSVQHQICNTAVRF